MNLKLLDNTTSLTMDDQTTERKNQRLTARLPKRKMERIHLSETNLDRKKPKVQKSLF